MYSTANNLSVEELMINADAAVMAAALKVCSRDSAKNIAAEPGYCLSFLCRLGFFMEVVLPFQFKVSTKV